MAPKRSEDTAGVDKAKRKRSSLPTQREMIALVISVLTKNSVLWFDNGCFSGDVLPHITFSSPTPDKI
ncbi:hypothetical protein E2C01_060049 [Portunus trituberculatus]|uniref:Uncharacterized protein n=1 Tax=Portunus trituberculatus TaxID=210409 RepID=A0A5B7GZZ3_PORTR|nr:hypothetical protein [Portunus trituberculatus]